MLRRACATHSHARVIAARIHISMPVKSVQHMKFGCLSHRRANNAQASLSYTQSCQSHRCSHTHKYACKICPAHEIWMLIASASNQCSDEPAHPRSHARAFAARIHICMHVKSVQQMRCWHLRSFQQRRFRRLFCLFCCFTSQVNSYGHCGTVSSPNHTFFLGKLEQAVYQ